MLTMRARADFLEYHFALTRGVHQTGTGMMPVRYNQYDDASAAEIRPLQKGECGNHHV